MAPRSSACEAVLMLSFAFGALLVAAGVVAAFVFALAFALVAFVERLSPPELQAATNMSVKDRSANPEISFRGNIGSPFELNYLVEGRREIIAKERREW